jgi:hypothetical protein
MMLTRLIPVLVILACVVGGCDGNPNDPSDTEDGEPTVAQLVGTWVATSIVFTSQQSQQSVDVIQQGGTARRYNRKLWIGGVKQAAYPSV